jgi:hypothetical protein
MFFFFFFFLAKQCTLVVRKKIGGNDRRIRLRTQAEGGNGRMEMEGKTVEKETRRIARGERNALRKEEGMENKVMDTQPGLLEM